MRQFAKVSPFYPILSFTSCFQHVGQHLVLFSGRALGHYARAREKLGVLTNGIGSIYQQNWESLFVLLPICNYLFVLLSAICFLIAFTT